MKRKQAVLETLKQSTEKHQRTGCYTTTTSLLPTLEQKNFLQSADFFSNIVPYLEPQDIINMTYANKSFLKFTQVYGNSTIFQDYYVKIFHELSTVSRSYATWYDEIKFRFHNYKNSLPRQLNMVKSTEDVVATSKHYDNDLDDYVEFLKCHRKNIEANNIESQLSPSIITACSFKTEIQDHIFSPSQRIYFTEYAISTKGDMCANISAVWYAKTKAFYFNATRETVGIIHPALVYSLKYNCDTEEILRYIVKQDKIINSIAPSKEAIEKLLLRMGLTDYFEVYEFFAILCDLFFSDILEPVDLYMDNVMESWDEE